MNCAENSGNVPVSSSSDQTALEAVDLRRWKIEKSLEIDTKWAEVVRQGGERVGLAAGAFLLGYPAFLGLVPGIAANTASLWPMGLALASFVVAGITYVDGMDIHKEASRAAYEAIIETHAMPSPAFNVPLAMNASTWKRSSKVSVWVAAVFLASSIVSAGAIVWWQADNNAATEARSLEIAPSG